MRTVPPSGRSRPAIMRRTVDLPDPDGPSSVVSLRSGASKLTPSTAAASLLKRLRNCSTTMAILSLQALSQRLDPPEQDNRDYAEDHSNRVSARLVALVEGPEDV